MMELPHGTLVRSFKGPMPLSELNIALQKDSFTGFMRASQFRGAFAEGVIVYGSGKPVIAYTSDGKSDRPDGEQKAIASIASEDDTFIELFSLNDGQLRLAMDFGRDLLVRPKPAPKPVEAPKPPEPKPMPVQRQSPPREKPAGMPEVRGSFVKSENAVSLRSYIESRKDETGHSVLIKQDGAGFSEYHLLLLNGKPVAAYSSAGSGDAFLAKVLHESGVTEFYRVGEAIIHSIIRMYPHIALSGEPEKETPKAASEQKSAEEQKPMQVLRPDSKPYVPLTKPEPIVRTETMAHGTVIYPPEQPGPMETHRFDASPKQVPGISAKALFDRGVNAESMGTPAPESKSTGALKGDIDDDADFVRKVEKEFVGNVDDLLKRLELSHLKVIPEKKKRT
ncbi:hypothetical protein MCP_2489 [Methanocella paludicola SANAE]|uniref:Uncharacterized protein n=1 Tax=Methanocella paludicola (strain DSM 17711 / JCM 13418 / NBRC 101707 / SANAE) TaxID=304371 RepID=D1Z1I9_METPS|nr:hypothetical protein [Methanocella paludicola]BAI62561.1 hypothetical protein MCP_2489 [Methanocella paludicola SANAE]